MQRNKYCFQWLAGKKKGKKSSGERNERNYMSQKEETEEMDEFRSQLGWVFLQAVLFF